MKKILSILLLSGVLLSPIAYASKVEAATKEEVASTIRDKYSADYTYSSNVININGEEVAINVVKAPTLQKEGLVYYKTKDTVEKTKVDKLIFTREYVESMFNSIDLTSCKNKNEVIRTITHNVKDCSIEIHDNNVKITNAGVNLVGVKVTANGITYTINKTYLF